MSILRSLFLTLLFVLLSSFALHAADITRVALVIGNDNYDHAPVLKTAVNDARGIASVLRKAGFYVIEKRDVKASEMNDAMDEFNKKAGLADIALVYFAGHGIQYEGNSYLIPVDVDVSDERDIRKAIPAEYILSDAGRAKEVGVLILDACRDNPFVKQMAERAPSRSLDLGRGLGRLQATPTKTLIAYATQAGNVALDGDEDSPYAKALMKYLPMPRKDIRLTFGAVRDEVLSLTNGKQEPYIYGSLGANEVYLVPTVSGSAAPSVGATEVPVKLSQLEIPHLDTLSALSSDYVSWKTALDEGDLKPLRQNAQTNPGFFSSLILPAIPTDELNSSESRPLEDLKERQITLSELNPDQIKQIKKALAALNYFGGSFDGQNTEDLERAFSAFRKSEKETGPPTYGSLIRLGEVSATRRSLSPLTGTWNGEYRYPQPVNGVSSVRFSMNLTFAGGRISGSVIEPNTFGNESSRNLYANFDGKIEGDRIAWRKQYDGTGGVSHAVTYEGVLNRYNFTVSGRWHIGTRGQGSFTLAKER